MATKVLKEECDLCDQKIVDLILFPSNLLWDFTSTLTVLNLSHNLIEILPEKLFSLWNLQKLNLFNNKIKIVPESISRLKKVNI
jgi:Leucine-rich repeat (LRR) protein